MLREATPNRREIVRFVLLAAGFTSLFYFIGPVLDSMGLKIAAALPAAALMFMVPGITATLAVGSGVARRGLWASLGELRFASWVWWPVAALLVPTIIVFGARLGGGGIPSAVSIGTLSLWLVGYLVAAVFEEIGWTAFLLPRIAAGLPLLLSAIIIGFVWGLWHVVPWVQYGRSAWWITASVAFCIVMRILIVEIVTAAGSVLPAVLLHASYNTAWTWTTLANQPYDPFVVAILTALAAAILVGLRVITGRRHRLVVTGH